MQHRYIIPLFLQSRHNTLNPFYLPTGMPLRALVFDILFLGNDLPMTAKSTSNVLRQLGTTDEFLYNELVNIEPGKL